ncbi:hypothetical protein ACFE04_007731 [Oxalis oulophora]
MSQSPITFTATILLLLLLLLLVPQYASSRSIFSEENNIHFRKQADADALNLSRPDIDLLEFPLNLEFLEAEFFLFGSLGYGLDIVNPNLTKGGPPPFGARKARLDRLTRDVISQFAFQEVGHLRAIQKMVKGFPRPQLDLSSKTFATVVNKAFGRPLYPPFDPYANSINYLLASYLIPYVGLTGYVGANPKLQAPQSRQLVAGLLGVESGQDAIIRGMLYERAAMLVLPYKIRVGDFTNKLSGDRVVIIFLTNQIVSDLRNKLGGSGHKDEGLFVQKALGAEGKTKGNVLAGDKDSLAFGRTPQEILRIVYGSGDEKVPGGFFPKGASGVIAQSGLKTNSTET